MTPSGLVSGLLLLAFVVLPGCATSVVVTPPLTETSVSTCQIHARVSYDGNPDYMPRALVVDPGASGQTTFRYAYDAQYGLKEPNPLIAVVNPLILVGFPTASDNLVIAGRVDIVHGDQTIRSYVAAAAMKRSSTVFYEGETFTEMRRRALLLVRDNLGSQLCRDQILLVSMLNDAAASSNSDDRLQP
jgi:hypothetical protein